MSEPQPHLGRVVERHAAQLSGQDLVSSPDPSAEGSRAGGCGTTRLSPLHKADAVTALPYPGPTKCHVRAHRLQKQRWQAHSTDEGAEAQSCAHLVTILQCFPVPSGWEQSPCLLGPATTSPTLSLQYPQPLHSTGHTHVPGLCSDFPHYVSPPYSHIILSLWQCHLFQEAPGSERNLHACAPHPWPDLTAVGGPGTEACVNEQASE